MAEPSALYLILALAAAAVATYVWRALGVALGGRLGATAPVMDWIGCVAYALLAGLILRMILLPAGPLADTPALARVGAAGLAVAVFFATRRNVALGVVAGTTAFTLWLWIGGPVP
ncbi:MAG: AzlD domain-containing protein [Rhodobacterales bacterium]|nr:AzlD domain-containing protein [Rhodobacterales bacterium]